MYDQNAGLGAAMSLAAKADERRAKVVEAELRERIGDLEYRLLQAEELLGL